METDLFKQKDRQMPQGQSGSLDILIITKAKLANPPLGNETATHQLSSD